MLTILSWKLCGHHPTAQNDIAMTNHVEQVVAFLLDAPPSIAVLETKWTDSHVKEFLNLTHKFIPDYRHMEILKSTSTSRGTLILVSKQPIYSRQSKPYITYRMGDTIQHLRFGILDVTISSQNTTSLRILATSMKDKIFHPAGQSEMRRNEFRIVSRHVRRVIEAIPHTHLLLLGCFNDDPGSAGLRNLISSTRTSLVDLRPLDADGDAWTQYFPHEDQYYRNDYALAYFGISRESPLGSSLLDCRIIDKEEARLLSLHRPIWITLNTLIAAHTQE